ncbi:MAG TPA: glucose-1-phosphate adenylyltransferase subunit GlgD [Clostridiales bacterium]|jgi:glucose-1-phosphate adenylyltransferase|nr:glucose-1-phosphate adenylyltransferase subunit GlgD [Clostridiales bacterium]
MSKDLFGLIYTGESNTQLRELTLSRSIAAVPFGGRYRCIDFILSSMVNSGIHNVGLITQKNYHSLIDHLGSGKEWDLNRKRDGLFILPPFVTKDNAGIYKGTAHAIHSCLGYIKRSSQRYVLLTGSHTIYNTVFDDMLLQHKSTGADITIMYNIEPDISDSPYEDLRLKTDASERICDLAINPQSNVSEKRSCDAFIMEKNLLIDLIVDANAHALYDFIRDILIKKAPTLKLYGYRYNGYVARLDSINDYFAHSLAILSPEVRNDLFNSAHPIYTKVKDEASARYGEYASVKNSMIADGCEIDGVVENSILFRGVKVKKGAVIKNSIIMQASEVHENSRVEYAILDKGVIIKSDRALRGYENFPIVLRKSSIV